MSQKCKALGCRMLTTNAAYARKILMPFTIKSRTAYITQIAAILRRSCCQPPERRVFQRSRRRDIYFLAM